MNTTSEINLLMIGKTGNGKSALGNSILKRREFASKCSVTSVTTELACGVVHHNGTKIKVVDGPGVGDTRLNTAESVDLVVKAMEQAMALNTGGFHAFLLVIRFGGRFTREDTDAIGFLKNIFGNDFVQRFCILVMTSGDNFERHRGDEDEDITFPEWCQQQQGIFQELLRECEHRIVLFDNLTKDETQRNAQIDELLRVVTSLQQRSHRYTTANFAQAQPQRDWTVVDSKKSVIYEVMFSETSLIYQKLEQIRSEYRGSKVSSLKALVERCDDLVRIIKDVDDGTEALRELMESANNTRQSVREALSLYSSLEEQRRVYGRREEEMRAEMDEEIERQRRRFERLMARERRS